MHVLNPVNKKNLFHKAGCLSFTKLSNRSFLDFRLQELYQDFRLVFDSRSASVFDYIHKQCIDSNTLTPNYYRHFGGRIFVNKTIPKYNSHILLCYDDLIIRKTYNVLANNLQYTMHVGQSLILPIYSLPDLWNNIDDG